MDATDLRNSCFLVDIIEYKHPSPYFQKDLKVIIFLKKEKFEINLTDFGLDGVNWMKKIISLFNIEKYLN